MSAHYDNFDYPSYWITRAYEHKAEILALNSLIAKIPKIKTILEIGVGFGRLVPTYLHRANKIILSDPSAKLLSMTQNKYKKYKKILYIQSSIENLNTKIKSKTIDLIILVRVLHHINDIDSAFSVIQRLVKKNGYIILEFANKRHWKAVLTEILHGNFTFPLDIFTLDIRSKKSISRGTIAFQNYHPDYIIENLKKHGFSIIETRSVSNVRSSLVKKILPTEVLLSIESRLQLLLAPIFFGPSIFILAKKIQ